MHAVLCSRVTISVVQWLVQTTWCVRATGGVLCLRATAIELMAKSGMDWSRLVAELSVLDGM